MHVCFYVWVLSVCEDRLHKSRVYMLGSYMFALQPMFSEGKSTPTHLPTTLLKITPTKTTHFILIKLLLTHTLKKKYYYLTAMHCCKWLNIGESH